MTEKLFELINNGVEQPKLVTLDSGFLISSGTDINNLTIEELLLLVHPYHQEPMNDSKNPNYEESRDQLVGEYKGPILIGFEDLRLPVSTAWLQELSPLGPRIIYQTHPLSTTTTMVVRPNKSSSNNTCRNEFCLLV